MDKVARAPATRLADCQMPKFSRAKANFVLQTKGKAKPNSKKHFKSSLKPGLGQPSMLKIHPAKAKPKRSYRSRQKTRETKVNPEKKHDPTSFQTLEGRWIDRSERRAWPWPICVPPRRSSFHCPGTGIVEHDFVDNAKMASCHHNHDMISVMINSNQNRSKLSSRHTLAKP